MNNDDEKYFVAQLTSTLILNALPMQNTHEHHEIECETSFKWGWICHIGDTCHFAAIWCPCSLLYISLRVPLLTFVDFIARMFFSSLMKKSDKPYWISRQECSFLIDERKVIGVACLFFNNDFKIRNGVTHIFGSQIVFDGNFQLLNIYVCDMFSPSMREHHAFMLKFSFWMRTVDLLISL